jgi:hypothetical protein
MLKKLVNAARLSGTEIVLPVLQAQAQTPVLAGRQ